jgi:hypothetical protein
MPTTIKTRVDTAANWASANPTLALGEQGIESDTFRVKFGTGATAWNSLSYAILPNMAADTLLGRGNGGGTGIPQSLTLGSNLSLTGTVLNAVAGSGGLDPRSSIYSPFTPTGNSDEFDNGSFSGWTAVNNGNGLATYTEVNDMLSVLVVPSTSGMQAQVKAATIGAGDYVEACVCGAGRLTNFHAFGLIMSDGTTYGAGAQVVFWMFPSLGTTAYQLTTYANFLTPGTTATYSVTQNVHAYLFMRLVYEGSNNWHGYVSPDGTTWVSVTGTAARTLTPTNLGFTFATGGAATQFGWSVKYVKESV